MRLETNEAISTSFPMSVDLFEIPNIKPAIVKAKLNIAVPPSKPFVAQVMPLKITKITAIPMDFIL